MALSCSGLDARACLKYLLPKIEGCYVGARCGRSHGQVCYYAACWNHANFHRARPRNIGVPLFTRDLNGVSMNKCLAI